MSNRRILMWITLIVIVVGVLIAIRFANTGAVKRSASQSPVTGTAQVGKKAPQFTAATNQGYFDLSKARKPVMLEVFATWCPHCQRETTILDRLYAKYKDRVDFVGVSGSDTGMDERSPASEQDVMNFASMLHAQYPLAYDGSLQVAHLYLQGGFPTIALIDRNKTVTYLTSGETPYAELDAAIKKVLRS